MNWTVLVTKVASECSGVVDVEAGPRRVEVDNSARRLVSTRRTSRRVESPS